MTIIKEEGARQAENNEGMRDGKRNMTLRAFIQGRGKRKRSENEDGEKVRKEK